MLHGQEYEDLQDLNRMAYKMAAIDVMELLTATAGVLVAEGLLSQRDSDELRILVSTQTPLSGRGHLWLDLAHEDESVQKWLAIHYGEECIGRNLFRLAMRKHLQRLDDTLCQIGQQLIDGAELFFNRPFSVYRGALFLTQTISSAPILELAQCIQGIRAQLYCTSKHLGPYICRSMITSPLDDQLAQSLGFTEARPCTLFASSEREFLTYYCVELTQLFSCVTGFLDLWYKHYESLDHTPYDHTQTKMAFAASKTVDPLWAMTKRPLQHLVRKEEWSALHIQMIEHTLYVEQTIRDTTETILAALRQQKAQPDKEPTGFSKQAVGEVAMLFAASANISLKLAEQETQRLIAYCKQHHTSPTELLIAEAKKLHPAWDKAHLSLLQIHSTQDPLMLHMGVLKENLWKLAKSLQVSFRSTMPLISAICLTLGSGCGYKKAPVSDVVDPRPQLPFKVDELSLNAPEDESVEAIPPSATQPGMMKFPHFPENDTDSSPSDSIKEDEL